VGAVSGSRVGSEAGSSSGVGNNNARHKRMVLGKMLFGSNTDNHWQGSRRDRRHGSQAGDVLADLNAVSAGEFLQPLSFDHVASENPLGANVVSPLLCNYREDLGNAYNSILRHKMSEMIRN
jgi:hypothetical protein